MNIEEIKEIMQSPKPITKGMKIIIQLTDKYVDFADFINEVIDFEGSKVNPEIYKKLTGKQKPP
ncbi:MAG: hypothetical protein A2312_00425 [Candidatus Staskawiczbacteria bacterium RIFOXYB2_FULL_32_9]|uniref:Uncharacterized protein n=1 Tax=Candidatus Staskawiczbacteria bacterium RIFOXYD1_FULL_32_13 TaxID=1802234 RepID=A0A1G2JKR7_9BACT|nr:MAG: hypothetical protein UR22_C0001G0071 [Parcubacteria group bacterium GW2011_GWC2_32_10]OGZ77571.1 MAG: hypothetical protein A2256_02310 [Candidatus Staskawiczbacteria bacterium RIFOXYA2_FULL_32_7]OGZ78272.1 MAG: hypothetical protein A2360_03840 [Candidatus Staskawiczbacteria bacterium RIFOXYB1_FULL_32_11]OGZ84558.1 MAG: hypothetical protein A2312_00425 [Candidatus Staskawiczbacteria bacterium RIFOXYB2_FULL_32_9]OGZ87252.1 MAG: hypothetical protein A2463_02725 [Candidatus Staskawiczbacter